MKIIRDILSAFAVIAALNFGQAAYAGESADDSSELSEVLAPAPEIKVAGQRVVIDIADEDNHTVVVYALTGQIVKSVEVSHGSTSIDLPAGYYIVKVDRVAKRVIVR